MDLIAMTLPSFYPMLMDDSLALYLVRIPLVSPVVPKVKIWRPAGGRGADDPDDGENALLRAPSRTSCHLNLEKDSGG